MGNAAITEFFDSNFIKGFWGSFQDFLCFGKYFDGRFGGQGLEMGTSVGTNQFGFLNQFWCIAAKD